MVLSGHCLRAKSHGNESASLESPGTMITTWFESKFSSLRFPAFFLEIIHLQEVGREEDIDRRAFVDLPRKAAGRAASEFYLCSDCA